MRLWRRMAPSSASIALINKVPARCRASRAFLWVLPSSICAASSCCHSKAGAFGGLNIFDR